MSACEFLASPEQSGPDGTDRTIEDRCRRLVGHVEHLGQHERLELRSSQSSEQRRREARFHPLVVSNLWSETFHEPAIALSEPDMIGTDIAADPQQPCHHTGVASERADRADRPEVGLLHQILDIGVGSQGVTQLPDVRLGERHELDQRRIIAFDRTRDHFAEDPVGRHHLIVPDCGLG